MERGRSRHSYLIQITADILQQHDPVHKDGFFVDTVLDTAGQKGTGKWTSVNALDMGIPANAIAEAVFARCLSALKDERVAAAQGAEGPHAPPTAASQTKLIDAIRDALYCSKICAYAQGFQLMREAQNEYKWKLNFGEIATICRGGCIIRARFLQKITEAYQRDRQSGQPAARSVLQRADRTTGQDATGARSSALAATNGVRRPGVHRARSPTYDGYRSARLPANLLQAQRDYFGAHTYERVDAPRGKFFHIDWPDPKRPQQPV